MTLEPNTKKRIFDIATNLFSTEGFHNVSMRQIAAHVGINSSSIYNHFESKDAILSEIFEKYERYQKNMSLILPHYLRL